jgi:hypothetical protein
MQRKLIPAFLLICTSVFAQSTDAKPPLTVHWTTVIDYYATHANFRFDLTQQSNKLTGKFRGDPLEGETDRSTPTTYLYPIQRPTRPIYIAITGPLITTAVAPFAPFSDK